MLLGLIMKFIHFKYKITFGATECFYSEKQKLLPFVYGLATFLFVITRAVALFTCEEKVDIRNKTQIKTQRMQAHMPQA